MAGGGLHCGLTFIVTFLGQPCIAMFTEGSALVPANGTSFISKFCFTFNPSLQRKMTDGRPFLETPSHSHWRPYERAGTLEVTVWAPTMMPGQRLELLLLDDEANSYPGSSSWNTLTCEDMTRRSRMWHTLRYEDVTQPAGQLVHINIKEKLRPRWWYLALNGCSNASLAAQFKVHAENDAYGWAREFSSDKRFVLFVFAPLAAAYACLAALQLHANSAISDMACKDDAGSKAAHPFVRILLAGIVLGLLAATLSVIHNVLYAYHGVAHPVAHVTAQFLQVSSNFALASLLLLVSQGKCISYVMVAADGWRMLRLLGPFLVSCFLLELWGDYSVSGRYSVDYVYTTPCGWALILVDLVLLGVYVKNLRNTYAMEHDRADAHFYRTWGVAYGIWFLALPVTAVLSQAILAPYVWCIVSLGVTKSVTLFAYTALVIGLWPRNRRTYFKLFASSEKVLEDPVTPRSPCARDRKSPSHHRVRCSGKDRFAGTYRVPPA
mmetsp:Transcript_9860/g.27820  ORF Transcript_9860/g.27820 Transcript_9860/m.27820 type:complete len:494 (-) Transcript_9860:128-1609(-)